MKPESMKALRSIEKSCVSAKEIDLRYDFSKLSEALVATNANETAVCYDFSKLSEALNAVRATSCIGDLATVASTAKQCDSPYDFTNIREALDDVKEKSKSSLGLALKARQGVVKRQPKHSLMFRSHPQFIECDEIVRKRWDQNRKPKSIYPIHFRLRHIVEIGASRGKPLRSSK